MTSLIDKLRNLFSTKPAARAATAVSPPPAFDDTTITRLMRQVEATEEGQYSCAETSALLDEYVELVTSKQDAAQLMPLVEAHLRACPECGQEYDILLQILETETP